MPVADAGLLAAALTAALGVRGQVRKRRAVHHWHNVRIHLDEVEGLGTFLEFEAVLSAGEDERASEERLRRLDEALRPGPDVAVGYADLLGL